MSIKDNDTTIIRTDKNIVNNIINYNWIQSKIIGTIEMEVRMGLKTNIQRADIVINL